MPGMTWLIQGGFMLGQQISTEYIDRMTLVMDGDVKRVIEFMESNVPYAKIVAVAEAIQKLAPIMWGQHEQEPIRALGLSSPIECASLQQLSTIG